MGDIAQVEISVWVHLVTPCGAERVRSFFVEARHGGPHWERIPASKDGISVPIGKYSTP